MKVAIEKQLVGSDEAVRLTLSVKIMPWLMPGLAIQSSCHPR